MTSNDALKSVTQNCRIFPTFTCFMLAIAVSACSNSSTFGNKANSNSATANATVAAQVKLTDRNFVASTLGAIYQVAPATEPSLSSLVLGQYQNFGGPCDMYAINQSSNFCSGALASQYVRNTNGTNQSLYVDIGTTNNTQAPVLPAATAGRESLMIRTCDLLNSNDQYVTNAVSGLDQGEYSATMAPGTAGLAAAYSTFYIGKTAPADVITQLQAISQGALTTGGTAIDQWRFVLLTLCIAPDWQIP